MSTALQQDLVLFNSIVEELLKEEEKNPVSPRIDVEDLYHKINFRLSEEACIDHEFIKVLKKLVLKTPKTATNRFFNQLWGGRNSKAVLGDLLAVMLNTSMYTYKVSGPQIGIEKEIINQICKIIGYGNDSGGTFPAGGSMANFMALVMARDKKDISIRNEGIQKKMIAYTSEESHYSNAKNISFAGIGIKNLRYIPTNNKGEMLAEKLEEKIQEDILNGNLPFYVNATAGTTVLGAFDPIDRISKVCKKHNIWLHVDGAYCGAVIFSSQHKKLLKGIRNSDSFSFNAHKMIGTPLTCSLLMVNKKKCLINSFDHDAEYLYQMDLDEYNLGRISLQCGRRNDALKFWTVWKAVGTKGLGKIVDHLFETANIARKYIIKNPDYTLYNHKISLSICFNYQAFDAKDLCIQLHQSNKLLVSYGSFKNEEFIRFVTINPENKKEDVLKFFKILEKFVEENKHNLVRKKMLKVS